MDGGQYSANAKGAQVSSPAAVHPYSGGMMCRHRKSWLVAGGFIEWCYECGAIRKMGRVAGTENAVAPRSTWAKPVGKGGKNPYNEMRDR